MKVATNLRASRQMGTCSHCDERAYVYPFHLENGGPLVCLCCGLFLHTVTVFAPLFGLQRRNAQRQSDAARLDGAIGALLKDHPLADELTARQIRQALQRDEFKPLPAERTIRLHLSNLRGNTT